MNPIMDGLVRGFRGVRTGDQRSLYTGALLLAYGLWRKNRGRHDLLYSRTLNPGEAIIVKASRGRGHEIVVGDELADKIRASNRPLRKT